MAKKQTAHQAYQAVVAPAEIVRTWDDQVVRNKAREVVAQTGKMREERIKALAERLTAAGIKARFSYVSHGVGLGGRRVLEIEDLDAIERLLYPGEGLERFTWKEGDIEIEG